MMNDLISRQSVLDIADDLRDRMTVEGYWSMVERMKALPSAQPEKCEECGNFNKARLLISQPQRTGRWIDDNCSECGQYVYHGDMRNFCPKCGADMREAKNEAD